MGVAWSAAIGLQDVDGLKPSEYLYETAKKNIDGEITIDEVDELINTYYETIRHLAVFISRLWQIHIFGEGNTRTTAVFFIKYLRHLGFDADAIGAGNHTG